ncbi:DUF3253 domain-containing protein [Frigoriflavimonas asaccharolytica]|uniref:DUF3253 domain-containing protein n=1 Tax=Frigoriflavimonas asaccharolytica TaxID=2735899 RepID=A0A8J8GBR9_9FLAO|nr:DUF3253 domain-containing protein [Frigoriflavimonas asaccharolytica]NRS93055.1 hypothetical protein [Frigoriflavimonas asaccharolytica]
MKISKLIETSHLKFAEIRGMDKTYCPSEVARELFPEDWRDHMNFVREVADKMVLDGKLVVLQEGMVQTNLP